MSEGDKDREIAELRQRLERLEGARPRPAPPPPPASPDHGCMNGCLVTGGLAGIFVLLMIAVLWVSSLTPSSSNRNPSASSTNPNDYIGHCAAGLVRGQRLAPTLYGMEAAPVRPVVLTQGERPARIECGIVSPTRTGQINVLVYCSNPLEMSCSVMERAWVDGRLVYPAERRMRRRANRRHD